MSRRFCGSSWQAICVITLLFRSCYLVSSFAFCYLPCSSSNLHNIYGTEIFSFSIFLRLALTHWLVGVKSIDYLILILNNLAIH